jgi:ubiquinone/menaquinone biosynthesis C-methylase UbiE
MSERPEGVGGSEVRRVYESGNVYSTNTICRKAQAGAAEYVDELLTDKLEAVRRNLRPGLVVDLCCATGDHLLGICGESRDGLGLDFSAPFIARATLVSREAGARRIRFAVADATQLPLENASVGTLYSLSSLYQVPHVERVFAEVWRVLVPGGMAILDLGNSQSLNALCVRAYPDLPPMTAIPVAAMLDLCRLNRLIVREHHAFQILPLWAGKPRWMGLLLHPAWKIVMKRRIRGRMIDEWISSSRLLRRFAFRHLLVVERE